MANFDPTATIEELRQEIAIRKKTRYSTSRLDRFKYEILSLIEAGGRPVEVQLWLKKHRTNVHLSTVTRWLAKHEI